ncbi:MAG: ImmA/IrrE family metallo-endopeptidase [bacterium]|nr:ImmA/IrrE family metallo-endopeptidase [bacterium]
MKMNPKVIRNEADYEASLARIDELVEAKLGTPEGDELDLLVTLVEMYEKAVYPIGPPDPVEAIRFRMEQMGLKQKDLIPFIGSRSKVSEVLSGQRSLSVSMMRKLHEGLGIPAEVLLNNNDGKFAPTNESVEWKRFPIAEMVKRRWFSNFQGTLPEAKKRTEELIGAWVRPLGSSALQPALLRQHVRAGSESDPYALAAWRIRVTLQAIEQKLPAYHPGTITTEFLRELVCLSFLEEGPLLAREFLCKNGIHFIVEPHLPHTHLDGAAIRLPDGSPLVALTLRYDRLDNFWFTLCHELAHVALHFDGGETEAFFDDLDQAGLDAFEKDADGWATEGLIPADSWRNADLGRTPSEGKIVSFARRHRIHPSIPAGRIRREKHDYKIFSKLVGNRLARKYFL